MSQTLTDLIKYLLNSVLTGFILFFSFQSMNMVSADGESSEVAKPVPFYSNGAAARNPAMPLAGMARADAEKTVNDLLDQVYAGQALGPSREEVKATIRKIATRLPEKPAAGDLMPADSDDTDVQTERILFLWQSFLSLMAPTAPAKPTEG
jgi:hypothetical protein